jgi:hypothetical protein
LLFLTLRQSTKFGRPQIDALSASATSRSHALVKTCLPSSSLMARTTGRQQNLNFLADGCSSQGHAARTSSNANATASRFVQLVG